MVDLISRQMAIDALKDRYYKYDRFAKLEELVWAINTVPSVQPEIIRCKDCKHRFLNENYIEGMAAYLKAGCELDTGDPFEMGRCAWNDEWYCADAGRREEGDE